ncbi:hypothetical protein RMS29_026620 (plasmid) [Agrobacterium rosae]|uniref:Uncharacterized protein n=1 Tax=Agrobacterium rosae TaxID=1972867 RepID=A0ABU4W364_9HYPH|nr:hypothetical protein [Agrobacterium rosae]MDX8331872.1 hypothetical protein [Agrobacterium rosae]
MALDSKRMLLAGVVALWPLGALADEEPNAFSQPSPGYLGKFAKVEQKVFVLERFDSEGRLASRDIEQVVEPVKIDGATGRTIAGHALKLRGLQDCPKPTVIYNSQQTWQCAQAAVDYAGAIYNKRATVILCKTLVLDPNQPGPLPASCFALVGNAGESLRVANDDDAMVYLGLADIALTAEGKPRRPDLIETQALSRSMGFQNAE